MNRVRTENRIGKSYRYRGAIQSTVHDSKFHTQRDAIAPPSSTRGGIDRNNWSQQTRTNENNYK